MKKNNPNPIETSRHVFIKLNEKIFPLFLINQAKDQSLYVHQYIIGNQIPIHTSYHNSGRFNFASPTKLPGMTKKDHNDEKTKWYKLIGKLNRPPINEILNPVQIISCTITHDTLKENSSIKTNSNDTIIDLSKTNAEQIIIIVYFYVQQNIGDFKNLIQLFEERLTDFHPTIIVKGYSKI